MDPSYDLLDVYETFRLAALEPEATPETKMTATMLRALVSIAAMPDPNERKKFQDEAERYLRERWKGAAFLPLRGRAEKLATILEQDGQRSGKATSSETAALFALRVLEGLTS